MIYPVHPAYEEHTQVSVCKSIHDMWTGHGLNPELETVEESCAVLTIWRLAEH